VPHPTALEYLSYIQNRRVATFKRLAEPKVSLLQVKGACKSIPQICNSLPGNQLPLSWDSGP
jgi:hypothetical protein